MIVKGEYYTLKLNDKSSEGFNLINDEGEQVLMPFKYVDGDYKIGDEIKVFIYEDEQNGIIATNLTPKISLGKFAYLEVVKVDRDGAYLDWNMPNYLFVPEDEQDYDMDLGMRYMVYLDYDVKENKLFASSKINNYLNNDYIDLKEGQKVEATIIGKSDLGYNVIVNSWYKGLIYFSDVFQLVKPGYVLEAYVKKIREDNNLDIVLQKQGFDNIEPNADKILYILNNSDGVIPLGDKSDPDDIYKTLQMSKKTFKKALGVLYKKKLVILEDNQTLLVK